MVIFASGTLIVPTDPAGSGYKTKQVMANKVYRVVSCIGRKRNVIWESKVFDANDGTASMNEYRNAVRAKYEHCMKLWADGYSFTNDNRYFHIGKNIDAGRIEIFLYSK